MEYLEPCPSPKPTPPAPAPAWADPIALMYQTAMRLTGVAIAPGTPTRLLSADPMRVALGFGIGTQAAMTLTVGPTPRPDLYGFAFGLNLPLIWIYLLEHGVMVNQEWYGFSAGMVEIGVYEVYRLF